MKKTILKKARLLLISLFTITSIITSTSIIDAEAAIRLNEIFSSYSSTYTAYTNDENYSSEHLFCLTYTQKADFLRAVDRVVEAIHDKEQHIEFLNYNISKNDMDSLATYIVHNYPELFYFGGFSNVVNVPENFEGSYNPDTDPVISFDIDYISDYGISESEIKSMQVKINKQTNIILEALKDKDLSDFDKVFYLNTYLTSLLSYNNSTVNCINIYGGLVENEVNCQGYAYTLKYFLDRLGIENYIALSPRHVWNVINLDGEFYNLDLTWTRTYNTQTYFLKSDEKFEKDHEEWIISAPNNIVDSSSNIGNNITCTSDLYKNSMSTSAITTYWQKTLAPQLNTTYIFSNATRLSTLKFAMSRFTNNNYFVLYTGDVNMDGVISIGDATLLQTYLADLKELSELQISIADVDGDGIISLDDVIGIQKYIANIYSEFPIDQNTVFDFPIA